MLGEAQREMRAIRELALIPTPQNFQSLNSKLEWLAGFLSRLAASPDGISSANPEIRNFLSALPVEMARLRTLMYAPAMFYQSLETIRAMHFGSYERSGSMRSLEPTPFRRTVVHL